MRLPAARALFPALLLLGACGEPAAPAPAHVGPEAARKPLVEKRAAADWCKEHGVPESVCTRCNAKLIAQFQEKGDWCKQHGLPDSQCLACHPELEAKFKAMAPKEGG